MSKAKKLNNLCIPLIDDVELVRIFSFLPKYNKNGDDTVDVLDHIYTMDSNEEMIMQLLEKLNSCKDVSLESVRAISKIMPFYPWSPTTEMTFHLKDKSELYFFLDKALLSDEDNNVFARDSERVGLDEFFNELRSGPHTKTMSAKEWISRHRSSE